MKYILFFSVILSTILFSCRKNCYLTISQSFNGLLPVTEWKASGPFEFDTIKQIPNNTYKNRDLEQFNINEDNFNINDFSKLDGTKYKPFKIHGAYSILNLFKYTDRRLVNNKSNIYLFTTIYSESNKDMILICDGSRNYKVWVNNINVVEVINKENSIKIGDRFLKIHLLKGLNKIFVKVNRGINNYSWGFQMTVASPEFGKKIFKYNYLTDYINDPVISDSIKIYLGPYNLAKLIIFNENNVIIKESQMTNSNNTINCSQLHNGLFQSKLILEDDTLSQLFFKGDIFEYIKELKGIARKINCDKMSMQDVKSNIERLDFLISKLDLSSEAAVKYYHRNLLYYSKILFDLLNYIKSHGDDKLISNISLKTYNQKKDSKTNNFLLHVNNKLVNNKTFPLICFIPYALVDSSLTKSWYIGNLDQMEMDRKMADEYGFAVCWVFLNGATYSPINATIDIKNVINRINSDYGTKSLKVYLVGECVGGKRALILAEMCPELFSGIAARAPSINDLIIHPKFFNSLIKIKNLPICIQHGIYDDEVPLNISEQFVKKASLSGLHIKFIKRSEGHLPLSRDERRYAFTFFDSIQNN